MLIFQGFSKVFTPLEALWVLSRAESQMCPAHDTALAAGIKSCKQETCCHFIQPADMTGGWLRHILVPSDYDVLTPVSQIFSCSFLSLLQSLIVHVLASIHQVPLFHYRRIPPRPRCLLRWSLPFNSLLLQILKIYKKWKVNLVVSLSFMDSHLFFMLFHFVISFLSNSNVLFYFAALQLEQELDLAQLVGADTQEATEYGKKHTLELLRKIREQLTEVGLQAAALPEDVAQKYILVVSV